MQMQTHSNDYNANETSYNAKEIGKLIKKTRKKLGVTQRSLALAAGCGLRFITELEHGKPTCELEKTLTVMKTLGIKFTLTES
ncbi:MAG: transcriptional regulator [Gammaproteobacteria bacterium]